MHDCRDYHFLSYYCAIKTWHTHACTQDACSLVSRPLLKKIGEPEDKARMLAHFQYNNTVQPKISLDKNFAHSTYPCIRNTSKNKFFCPMRQMLCNH